MRIWNVGGVRVGGNEDLECWGGQGRGNEDLECWGGCQGMRNEDLECWGESG